jgi:hypothetical protein
MSWLPALLVTVYSPSKLRLSTSGVHESRCRAFRARKQNCTVAPNIDGSSICNLLHAGFWALRIFEVAARFLENLCGTMRTQYVSNVKGYSPFFHPDHLTNVTKPCRLLIPSRKFDLPNFDGRYSVYCNTALATLASNSWSNTITG